MMIFLLGGRYSGLAGTGVAAVAVRGRLVDDHRMADVNEWNRQIIEEFRSNSGTVGGQFEGVPILLLHSVGARSGAQRINPLAYQALDRGYAIFASFAGAPKNPAWYYNLVAQPNATVEVGTRTETVTARVVEGAERERIWERQKAELPVFAGYEEKTERTIPVVVLEPNAS
jgi:deazaflavin-dependent oxidoreductase (nitroreductase family)